MEHPNSERNEGTTVKNWGVPTVFFLVFWCGSASAQVLCPNSGMPMSQDPGCVKYSTPGEDEQQQTQQPQQPSGYWEKTWGAIATSETGGALGVIVGASGENLAKQLAMADCNAKGGGGCRVDLVYQNQCAAMLIGDGFLRLYSAATVAKAAANGMNECRADSKNCRVYYAACTEPIWHSY